LYGFKLPFVKEKRKAFISVHWSLPCMVVFFVQVQGLPLDFVLLLYAYVFVHEVGHAKAAIMTGRKVQRIGLHALGGYALIPNLTRTSWNDLVIFAAGPLTNLALGGIFTLLGDHPLLNRMADINFFLAALNFLPAWPLDGGNVLLVLLYRMGLRETASMKVTLVVSNIGILALGYLAWCADDWLLLVLLPLVLTLEWYCLW